jgi:uncharacterized OsmC-like protein
VEVRRVGQHSFVGTNDRGAEVRIGRQGQQGSFTPVELLLAAAAGCVAVTAESLITRRIGEEAELLAFADDVRPENAHELKSVPVRLDFDPSTLDDEQREALEKAVRRAVDQLCTVTRTLKRATATPLELPS